jgi:uncharacterized protein (TIGR02186 family)
MRRAMAMKAIPAAITLMVLAFAAWAAEPLVADLSSHRITIDSGFVGSEVLLYGAVDGKADVIVVVRGPEERVTVRRKERIAGVWINADAMVFEHTPAYYAVAANRPLDEIAHANLLALYQIGLDVIVLPAEAGRSTEDVAEFREALIRNKIRQELYYAEIGKLSFLGERLFRTLLTFPGNVPTGTYMAEIFMIRDGTVVSAETTPLFISKTGYQAEIGYLARSQPALYGISAIVVALFAGWAAAAAFRRF